MRKFKLFALFALLKAISCYSQVTIEKEKLTEMTLDPKQALERLINGNQRYIDDRLLHPDRSSEHREALVANQKPFAIIVGCSDSRVPPEILFDQGLGDLFVVRVAGNVVGPIELASVKYSAVYLNSSLILVLGHQNCGAVNAVLSGQIKDIEAVSELLQPAVTRARGLPGLALENAIKENVKLVVKQLQNSQGLQDLIRAKKIAVVGGYYNLNTGLVELLY